MLIIQHNDFGDDDIFFKLFRMFVENLNSFCEKYSIDTHSDGYDIEIILKNDNIFDVCAYLNTIKITKVAIDFSWNFSYYCIMAYSHFFAGESGLRGQLNITNEKNEIWQLLQNIRFDYKQEDIGPDNQPHNLDNSVVNDSFKYCWYFIILHELDHIIFKKSTGIKNEIECDEFAANAIKNLLLSGSTERQMIIAGTIIGTLLLFSLSADSHEEVRFKDVNHPKAYNRVLNVLQHILSDEDESWAFLLAMLNLECEMIGVHPDQKVRDNFIEAIKYFIEILRQKYGDDENVN